MAQINTAPLQTRPALPVSTELPGDGVVSAFKKQMEQRRKKQHPADQAGPTQAMHPVPAQELARPAMQLKLDAGRIGSRAARLVNQQLQALAAVDVAKNSGGTKRTNGTKSAVHQVAMASRNDSIKGQATGLTATAPATQTPKTEQATAHATQTPKTETTTAPATQAPKAEPATELTQQTRKTESAAIFATPAPGIAPASTSMLRADAINTTMGTTIAPESPGSKKKPAQEPNQNTSQSAQTLPAADMPAAQIPEAQSGRPASQPGVAQYLASRQASMIAQAPQGDPVQGTELTYRFNTWGNQHAVKVQTHLQPRTDTPQLLLQPSDALVAQRLNDHLPQSLSPAHWTLVKDGEERGRHQMPAQTDDEEEAT